MRIRNYFREKDLVQEYEYPRYIFPDAGSDQLIIDPSTANASLLHEHTLEIYVQNKLTMRLVCTAKELPELILGRLLTEGVIKSSEEIDFVYVCPYGLRGRVFLKNSPAKSWLISESSDDKKEYAELTPSCCTGNHTLIRQFTDNNMIDKISPVKWDFSLIRLCESLQQKDTPLHMETSSTHSACLIHHGTSLYESEDIGRHNAIDKVIGHALIEEIDLSKCFLYTTGRIPVDVMQKVLRSGIPLIATKESPTFEALSLAQEYGLTVIGKIKHGRCVVYAGQEPAG